MSDLGPEASPKDGLVGMGMNTAAKHESHA